MAAALAPLGVLCAIVLASQVDGGEASERVPEQFRDAPAVFLERYRQWSIEPFKASTSTHKNRLLIQDRRGLEHADQLILIGGLHGDLESFSARTVLPDGKVVPVPEELQHSRTGQSSEGALHFTFPQARPGAVLEWEYRLVDKQGIPVAEWTGREDVPVLESRFEARLTQRRPDYPQLLVAFPRGEPSESCEIKENFSQVKNVTLDLVCRNVPAVEDEPYSPPLEDIRLDFVVTTRSIGGVLTTLVRDGDAESELKSIRGFGKKRDKLAATTAKLLHAETSTAVKLQVVHDFIRQNLKIRDESVTTEQDEKKGKPVGVDDVVERGGGTPREIAMVALVMLEEARIWARPIIANDRSEGRFEPHMLGGADHLMIELRVNDQPWFFDPSCFYCRPGLPHWRYCDTIPNAISLDARLERLNVPLSPSERSREDFSEAVSIDATGATRIVGSANWTGHEDVWLREQWEPMSEGAREDSFRLRLSSAFDSVSVKISDPRDWKTPLRVDYTMTAGGLPRTEDGRILLLPTDHVTSGLMVPVHDQRQNPIWIPFQHVSSQITTFELPAGFEVAHALPARATIKGPGHTFTYSWSRNAEGKLVWAGVLDVSTTWLEVTDYGSIVKFLAQVRKAIKTGVIVQPVRTAMEPGA